MHKILCFFSKELPLNRFLYKWFLDLICFVCFFWNQFIANLNSIIANASYEAYVDKEGLHSKANTCNKCS